MANIQLENGATYQAEFRAPILLHGMLKGKLVGLGFTGIKIAETPRRTHIATAKFEGQNMNYVLPPQILSISKIG